MAAPERLISQKRSLDYALESAEGVVLRAAERRQIVILNEMHHQVEHRCFCARLIPHLAARGVRYLAWESDDQPALDEAMRTSRITPHTGSSGEPQKAEILRAALRAGMQLVAFDFLSPEDEEARKRDPSQSVPVRETAMVRNLSVAILQRDPDAKLFIYAGGQHGAKTPQWQGMEWMAMRLWQRTGIEPFSVMQMSDAGDPPHDWKLYHLLVKEAGRRIQEPMALQWSGPSFNVEAPAALREHPICSYHLEHGVDAIVLHPPEPFENGVERPAWLKPADGAEITGRVHRAEAPCAGYLAQALVEAEGELSTPADQVLTDAAGRYQLRVRPGRYLLRTWAPAEVGGEDRIVAMSSALAVQGGQQVQQDIVVPA
jgi:hypothetical protein